METGFETDDLDKLAHAGMYGLWALIFVAALSRSVPALGVGWVCALGLVATVFAGAFDEVHQSFVPERSSDPLDLAADAAGGLLAVAAWWLLTRFSRLPPRNVE